MINDIQFDITPAKIAEIEARARVLRAEAARDGARAFRAALAEVFGGLFGRKATAAS